MGRCSFIIRILPENAGKSINAGFGQKRSRGMGGAVCGEAVA